MATRLRCLIYTRISKDTLGGRHSVANQLADLEKRAEARGWTVVYRLSDNDIGVTRKDPTATANLRLDEIGAELDHAARENVLAPLVAAVWEDLDLSRKRAIINCDAALVSARSEAGITRGRGPQRVLCCRRAGRLGPARSRRSGRRTPSRRGCSRRPGGRGAAG
jgi:hypothetical protein